MLRANRTERKPPRCVAAVIDQTNPLTVDGEIKEGQVSKERKTTFRKKPQWGLYGSLARQRVKAQGAMDRSEWQVWTQDGDMQHDQGDGTPVECKQLLVDPGWCWAGYTQEHSTIWIMHLYTYGGKKTVSWSIHWLRAFETDNAMIRSLKIKLNFM